MRRFKRRSARFYAILVFVLALISSALTCSYLESLNVPTSQKSKATSPKKTSSNQADEGLADLIPDGMRAFAINLGEHSSTIAGLKAGNYVDVVATFDTDTSEIPKAKTAVERRRILSIDRAGNIVLLVAPDEAETLASALAHGKIAISLCPTEEER